MYRTIGEFLKKLRLERKFTQAHVAQKLGISRQAYAYYERSAALPDLNMLLRLVPLYQISIDTFLVYYPQEVSEQISKYTNLTAPHYDQMVYPEFLTFYTKKENMKKYHYLNHSEKELLFMFQKLSKTEQQELLLWAYFKSTICQETNVLP